MVYGRPLFTLMISGDNPVVEIHNIGGFAYSGISDGKMVFKRYWTDPEDRTFHKLNEVNKSVAEGDGLRHTNTVHVQRNGPLFSVRCYFEGPRLGMLNGKNALIDTTPEPGYYCSPGFRDFAEKMMD